MTAFKRIIIIAKFIFQPDIKEKSNFFVFQLTTVNRLLVYFIYKNSSICLLQFTKMLTQRSEFSLSNHTLCGPFDEEFRKKFIGNRSLSLYSSRNKLTKLPSSGLTSEKKSQSTKNLLPKIREIEKIARSTGKKMKKINLYVDGVSDLELYFAKKLVSNQSTKEIIAQIQLHHQGDQNNKFNSLSMGNNQTFQSRTTSKFYGKQQISQSQQGHALISASKTSYSSHKKWVTDAQFRQQFDKFIIKKPEEQTSALTNILGGEVKESSSQLIGKLQKDKQNLRKIVKKMIQDQNYETDEEQDQNQKRSKKESTEQNTSQGGKNINWILKKCEDYQRKFTIKKGGSKAIKAGVKG